MLVSYAALAWLAFGGVVVGFIIGLAAADAIENDEIRRGHIYKNGKMYRITETTP